VYDAYQVVARQRFAVTSGDVGVLPVHGVTNVLQLGFHPGRTFFLSRRPRRTWSKRRLHGHIAICSVGIEHGRRGRFWLHGIHRCHFFLCCRAIASSPHACQNAGTPNKNNLTDQSHLYALKAKNYAFILSFYHQVSGWQGKRIKMSAIINDANSQ
jgi:hypothetical protein